MELAAPTVPLEDNTAFADEYVVETIHRERKVRGTTQYEVEWEGYPNSKDFTWEPETSLIDEDGQPYSALQDFKRRELKTNDKLNLTTSKELIAEHPSAYRCVDLRNTNTLDGVTDRRVQ